MRFTAEKNKAHKAKVRGDKQAAKDKRIADQKKKVDVLNKLAVNSEKADEALENEIKKAEAWLVKARERQAKQKLKTSSLFRRFNSADDKLAKLTALKLPKGM